MVALFVVLPLSLLPEPRSVAFGVASCAQDTLLRKSGAVGTLCMLLTMAART